MLHKRPTPGFKRGDTFVLCEGNFGSEYDEMLFVVNEWYDHEITGEECVAPGERDTDPHGSLCFDNEMPYCLYDTTFPETSLYEGDMVYISPSERASYLVMVVNPHQMPLRVASPTKSTTKTMRFSPKFKIFLHQELSDLFHLHV